MCCSSKQSSVVIALGGAIAVETSSDVVFVHCIQQLRFQSFVVRCNTSFSW